MLATSGFSTGRTNGLPVGLGWSGTTFFLPLLLCRPPPEPPDDDLGLRQKDSPLPLLPEPESFSLSRGLEAPPTLSD